MTEVDEHCRRAPVVRLGREKGRHFVPSQKVFMPFVGGLLGTLVLGAATFGLVAGSGMQTSGASVSDLGPSTSGNGSVPAAGGSGPSKAKPSIPPVTEPSTVSLPP